MSKVKIILTGIILTATVTLFSCNEAAEKNGEIAVAEESKYELVEPEPKREVVQSDEVEKDYNIFKLETDRMLAENEAKMLALKIKLMTMNADTRTKFQKDLDVINEENEKLKSNIKSFKKGTRENWDIFKTTINKDVDRLGKSISALADNADRNN
jgi:hypothetical protein